MKKQYIFLMIAAILGTIVFVTILLFPRNQVGTPEKSPQPQESVFPLSSTVREKITPPKMDDLVYIPQEHGGGIDTKSNQVKQSEMEIEKLSKHLPFQESITLSSGKVVEILIPAKELQFNQWTLTVQIFNIKYQEEEDSQKDEEMKKSFLEAANYVFSWMKDKGVNPDNVIISWGDRAFIQSRAEKWLDSQ
jgi:hypothetical protein